MSKVKIMHSRIRSVRDSLKLTRHEFALKLKQKEEKLKSVELDRQAVPADMIASIVENYNVNPYYLLLGRGKMFEKDEVKESPHSYTPPLATRHQKMIDFIGHAMTTWDEEHKIWLDVQMTNCILEFKQFKEQK